MSRLFRSNSSVRSRTSLSIIPDIVNEEEHEFQELTLDLGNWNIPKVSIKEIYKSSFLQSSFKVDMKVKIVEQVYALTKEHEKYSLLNK